MGNYYKKYLITAMTIFSACTRLPAQEKTAPASNLAGDSIPVVGESATKPGWIESDNLTGDWGGGRSWLGEHGIILKPRLTQFYQDLAKGDGSHGFEYGGKADLLFNADLGKLGLWKGFSFTVHAEYNFGNGLNGSGGTVVPVNTALYFPGMDSSDAFDLSSFYLQQQFGKSVTLVIGKINMIDFASTKPFMGGAGINAFWNCTFAAPPSGTVPPYLFGALLVLQTKSAKFGLWVYDPLSVVNKSGLKEPFTEGITFRGNVDIPVTIAGLQGHQGFVALYSTQKGTDLEGDLILPPLAPGTSGVKNFRYYFNYSFDQYLFQSPANPQEGVGLFGQIGISDGNPNPLRWSALAGISGKGLIPGRSRDNWGVGYYYDGFSKFYEGSIESIEPIRDEQGLEIFYKFSLTPWLGLGTDLQIIRGATGKENAVFAGLSMVINL